MKKIASILFIGLMILNISGCVSRAEFEALESRVDALEQNNSSPITQMIETPIIETELTFVSSEEIATETEKQFQIYSLDGMSGEEIFNHLTSISTSIPAENYADKFLVEPWLIFDGSYRFWGSENGSYTNTNPRPENLNNYIDQVDFWIQREMDGTIIADKSAMHVRLYLNNYDVAADLFDRIFSYLD